MLKRLWDTDNKKIIWVEWPSGRLCQAWTNEDGSKLYVYDNSKWYATATTDTTVGYEYWPTWKQLADEEVGFYDTNEATELYSWDKWAKVTYQFSNYDGTVLESWTIAEWATPEYTGETPTKPDDEENTYTFSGWKPTVWPIYKKTNYKAQFTATPIS